MSSKKKNVKKVSARVQSAAVSYPVILTENFLTVIANDKELSITKTDARFAQAKELYKKGNYEALVTLLDRPAAIERYTSGLVKVYDGIVTHNGVEVNGAITKRILQFVQEGLPIKPLVNFLNNLYLNTSEGVREKLYSFLEHNHLGITEDGLITAFKLVTADGSPPMHPGTFFETQKNGTSKSVSKYRVGYEYTFPREQIREGTQECGSVGLYLANKNYWAGNFNDKNEWMGDGDKRLLIAEVHPKDVCNVARNESSKMVVCRMRLVGEYKSLHKAVNKAYVKSSEFGIKPNGQRFHNKRDAKGHFVKAK